MSRFIWVAAAATLAPVTASSGPREKRTIHWATNGMRDDLNKKVFG